MNTIRERAQQYHDGLITAREMLGFISLEIGNRWDNTLETDYATEFADDLSAQLLK